MVRQRSAKPLFPGSNPGAPSKKFVPVAQLDQQRPSKPFVGSSNLFWDASRALSSAGRAVGS